MKPTIQETLSVMKDVDSVLEADSLEKSQADWVRSIKEEYAKQGVAVSEDVIQKSIAARTKARYVFKEPKGWSELLVKTAPYHKAVFRGSLLAVVAVSVLSVGMIGSKALDQNRLQAAQKDIALVHKWSEETDKAWSASRVEKSEAARLMYGDFDALIHDISVASQNPPESLSEAKVLVSSLDQKKSDLLTRMNSLENSLRFDEWFAVAPKPRHEWTSQVVETEKAKRQTFASSQSFDQVRASEDKIKTMYEADQGYAQSVKALSDWPSSVASKKKALLDQEAKAWIVSTSRGRQAHDETLAIDRFFKSSITFKVASAPGEKTGVWRTMEGTGIKNFYIVVHPVDPSDNPVVMSVLSEETGQTKLTDMFAFRVSEDVYESVKEDKTDDGIVQKNNMGQKPSMSFDVEFIIPSTGGMITEW